jgi:hypothetical protein
MEVSRAEYMEDTKPYPLNPAEWKEMMANPVIRKSWGIEANNTTLDEFSPQVYAAKFNFVSGSPGYIGDLFILQGDHLTGDAPMVLRRDGKG